MQRLRRAPDPVGGEIEVIFDEATVNRLGAFLATGRSPVIHFSCHGHPEFLLMEDVGASQQLHVKELKQLISKGGGHLKVVFLSACNSLEAGKLLLEAGIEHVICTNASVRDWASSTFAQHFYRALAGGRKLKESFELARDAVLTTPTPDGDSRIEMNKFVLLPEKPEDDPYHDVDVFYTSPMGICSNPKAVESRSQHESPSSTRRIHRAGG